MTDTQKKQEPGLWPWWPLLLIIPVFSLSLSLLKGPRFFKSYYEWQMLTEWGLLGLVFLRFIAARLFRERNYGWVIYSVLLLISPLLVSGVFEIVLKMSK